MPAPLWWWIGLGAAGAATVAGGTLVVRERRRRKVQPPQPGLGVEPPRPSRTTPPGAMPPPPKPSRTTPPGESVTQGTEDSGSIVALVDAPRLQIGDPYEGKTRLRPTPHVFTLFDLPRAAGTFNVQVCVSLDYDFQENQLDYSQFLDMDVPAGNSTFTFARILKWEDGQRVRLFGDPHVQLYDNGQVLGEFARSGKLDEIELHDWSNLRCGGAVRFPTEPAFMYMARLGDQPTLISWNAFTWDGTLSEGQGSDQYRPRWTVFVEDGQLKLRIWVSPMPMLRHTREGQASVEAVETPYSFAYSATLNYET